MDDEHWFILVHVEIEAIAARILDGVARIHYMPAEHRTLIEAVEQLPDLRQWAAPTCFNQVLDAMANFREVHYGWAEQYIHRHTDDPRGTGGTPFMQWLRHLIDETRATRLPD